MRKAEARGGGSFRQFCGVRFGGAVDAARMASEVTAIAALFGLVID